MDINEVHAAELTAHEKHNPAVSFKAIDVNRSMQNKKTNTRPNTSPSTVLHPRYMYKSYLSYKAIKLIDYSGKQARDL